MKLHDIILPTSVWPPLSSAKISLSCYLFSIFPACLAKFFCHWNWIFPRPKGALMITSSCWQCLAKHKETHLSKKISLLKIDMEGLRLMSSLWLWQGEFSYQLLTSEWWEYRQCDRRDSVKGTTIHFMLIPLTFSLSIQILLAIILHCQVSLIAEIMWRRLCF